MDPGGHQRGLSSLCRLSLGLRGPPETSRTMVRFHSELQKAQRAKACGGLPGERGKCIGFFESVKETNYLKTIQTHAKHKRTIIFIVLHPMYYRIEYSENRIRANYKSFLAKSDLFG